MATTKPKTRPKPPKSDTKTLVDLTTKIIGMKEEKTEQIIDKMASHFTRQLDDFEKMTDEAQEKAMAESVKYIKDAMKKDSAELNHIVNTYLAAHKSNLIKEENKLSKADLSQLGALSTKGHVLASAASRVSSALRSTVKMKTLDEEKYSRLFSRPIAGAGSIATIPKLEKFDQKAFSKDEEYRVQMLAYTKEMSKNSKKGLLLTTEQKELLKKLEQQAAKETYAKNIGEKSYAEQFGFAIRNTLIDMFKGKTPEPKITKKEVPIAKAEQPNYERVLTDKEEKASQEERYKITKNNRWYDTQKKQFASKAEVKAHEQEKLAEGVKEKYEFGKTKRGEGYWHEAGNKMARVGKRAVEQYRTQKLEGFEKVELEKPPVTHEAAKDTTEVKNGAATETLSNTMEAQAATQDKMLTDLDAIVKNTDGLKAAIDKIEPGGGGGIMSGLASILGAIGLGKFLGKGGAKVAEKGVEKVAEKSVAKSILKKIPIISLLAGGAFAIDRLMSGDKTGAAMEMSSGIAGTVPGLGTAASLGIDAAILARDSGAFETPEKETSLESIPKETATKVLNKTAQAETVQEQRNTSTPPTVNAPVITNNTTNVNGKNNSGQKLNPRNPDNSFIRYQDSRAIF